MCWVRLSSPWSHSAHLWPKYRSSLNKLLPCLGTSSLASPVSSDPRQFIRDIRNKLRPGVRCILLKRTSHIWRKRYVVGKITLMSHLGKGTRRKGSSWSINGLLRRVDMAVLVQFGVRAELLMHYRAGCSQQPFPHPGIRILYNTCWIICEDHHDSKFIHPRYPGQALDLGWVGGWVGEVIQGVSLKE